MSHIGFKPEPLDIAVAVSTNHASGAKLLVPKRVEFIIMTLMTEF